MGDTKTSSSHKHELKWWLQNVDTVYPVSPVLLFVLKGTKSPPLGSAAPSVPAARLVPISRSHTFQKEAEGTRWRFSVRLLTSSLAELRNRSDSRRIIEICSYVATMKYCE